MARHTLSSLQSPPNFQAHRNQLLFAGVVGTSPVFIDLPYCMDFASFRFCLKIPRVWIGHPIPVHCAAYENAPTEGGHMPLGLIFSWVSTCGINFARSTAHESHLRLV